MPDLLMPDQDFEGEPPYPAKYKYSKTLQKWYEGEEGGYGFIRPGGKPLPQTILAIWACFGNPAQVRAVPETSGVPDIPPLERSRFPAYAAAAERVRQAFIRLQHLDRDIAAVAVNSARISRAGREAIEQTVIRDGINLNAKAIPRNGMTEDQWIMTYLEKALVDGKNALDRAMAGQRGLAHDADGRTQEIADLRRQLQQRQDADRQRADGNDAGIDRRLTERQRRLQGQDRDRELRDLLSQLQRSNTQQQAQFRQPELNRPPAAATPDASARGGPGGLGGLDPISLMRLSQLGGIGRGSTGLDAGRNDRLWEERDALRGERERLREREERLRDQERRDRNVPPAAAAVVPAAAANPPPPLPPPKLNESGPPHAQPAKDDAAQGGAPARTPGEDGKVLYTFTDGRQQRVWPIVAQALDVALADNAGTNAQAAYKDTPAKWSDDKSIGGRIDPAQLTTGDVCGFEKGTAIAVVWGSPDSGGSLELVINGQLRPFEPDSKDTESLGAFTGFFHPNIGQGVPGTGGHGAPAVATSEHQVAPVPAG